MESRHVKTPSDVLTFGMNSNNPYEETPLKQESSIENVCKFMNKETAISPNQKKNHSNSGKKKKFGIYKKREKFPTQKSIDKNSRNLSSRSYTALNGIKSSSSLKVIDVKKKLEKPVR